MTVVGHNSFIETAESPLGGADAVLRVDAGVHDEVVADLDAWRADRDEDAVAVALDELRTVAATDANIVPATRALARAGGTTGEWAGALRQVFGEYQAPTGVGAASGRASTGLREVAERCKGLADGPPRFLVAKPGLDGHSNGAEQIAIAARDAGMEVIYQGIRHTPELIAQIAADESQTRHSRGRDFGTSVRSLIRLSTAAHGCPSATTMSPRRPAMSRRSCRARASAS